MFTVTCPAEVIERRDGYFLLDTPIIGLAQCFFKNCPRNMSVGDIWNVNMHRQKDKKGTLVFLFDKYQAYFPYHHIVKMIDYLTMKLKMFLLIGVLIHSKDICLDPPQRYQVE